MTNNANETNGTNGHNLSRQAEIRKENTDKLWNVFVDFKNDSDRLTKRDLISLADFNMAEDGSREEIFRRALKACRARAEREDMIIPRAIPCRSGGYGYVLTDNADLAIDSFLASQRVTQGMQDATYRHEFFIDANSADLDETTKVIFYEMKRIDDQRREFMDESLNDQHKMLVKLRDAAREDEERRREERLNT